MSLVDWLWRRKQTAPALLASWERVAPIGPDQSILDTRRYVEHSDYQLPKDEEEDIRLNFQHHALYHAIGNHYVAPLSPPLQSVLDVGTGTGIWASEMARLFPTAIVVGLDLVPSSFKLPSQENCLLRIGNVLTGLPFPDEFFSYTHQRLLVAAITATNWPRVIHELVRVTRRNGWIELVEMDDQMQHAGPATARMQELIKTVSQSMGFDGEVIRHLGDMLKQERLQRVEMQPIPIPVGDWAGRVGHMLKHDLLAATNALRGRYCTQASLAGEEFDRMVQAMVQEWEVYRPSCTIYAAYGRKEEA